MIYYVLDPQHNVVPTPNIREWALFYEDSENRRVASDVIEGRLVSTVFLGIDHQFGPSGPPLLFETMVFDGIEVTGGDIYCVRYETWAEAEAGHQVAVGWVRAGCPDE